MKTVKIGNKIKAIAQRVTIGQLHTWYSDKELISINDFLQRELLVNKWSAKDYQNCKEYIASCYKETNIFDSFSVVVLEKLIQVVKEKTQSEQNDIKREEFNKLLEKLEDYQSQGTQWISMDGQSRLMLGIDWYIGNKFNLDKSGKFIQLLIDGKQSNCLQTNTFSNLPVEVQNYFKSIIVVMNIVEDFSELEDVVEALVNKQKGFDWTWFQIVKQSKRFNLSTIKLIEAPTKNFKKLYKEKLYSLSNDYIYDADGYQLFLTNMAYFIQTGNFPTKNKVKELFTDDIKITDESYKKVQEYSLEYFTALGKSKSTLTPLINFICLRQLLDGKKNGSKFLKEVGLDGAYIVNKPNKFVDWFVQLHAKLSNKKTPHKASFIFDSTDNNWVWTKVGYGASCGKQDDENIYRRMKTFVEYIDFDYLIKNEILVKVKNTTMPSLMDVAVRNDFKDLNGESVSIGELPLFDRSHKKSKYNKGSNELENLVLENYSDNRSHQEEDIK
jgi:hypothetical protein